MSPTLAPSAPAQKPAKNAIAPHPAKAGETFLDLGPDVRVELLEHDGLFHGLGRVEIAGVALRGNRRPMFVELRTADGVEFFDFSLTKKTLAAGSATLEFSMRARKGGLQEWMAHTVRNLRTTGDWANPAWTPKATLKLHLHATRETFRGRVFRGFEYWYEYASAEHPIYRLLDRSSWGLGGSVVGNTFWLRNSFAPSRRTFASVEESHSTEWYLGTISNPNIFQFQPFQTNLESFSMTTSPAGQLCILAPRLSHIRSLFEKPSGVGELLHWHEHCNDLSGHFTTAPIQVLFSPEPATETDLVNLNEAVRTHVAEALHQQAGMRRERVQTYGIIEEWTLPDMACYSDEILPKFLALGLKCIMVPNQFQHNMNMWGVSNMCATVDYRMPDAETEALFHRFCQKAREAGAAVQLWGNTALSTLNCLLRPQDKKTTSERIDFLPPKDSIFDGLLDLPGDPYIRNPSGAIEADHYTPIFAALNLRNPAVVAYWHRRWKYAHDHIGVNGIFLDSSFNLSSDKFHFSYNAPGASAGATADQSDLIGQRRPEKTPPQSVQTMYFAHLALIAEMQRYGYHYSGEDVGVFGLHRSGPDIGKRLGDLFMWSDSYVGFDQRAIRAAGGDLRAVFFEGLACRLMWSLSWNFELEAISFSATGRDKGDLPEPWHLSLLAAFNEAEPFMIHRTVLEEGRGVLYEAPNGERVLWAFKDQPFPLADGERARDLLTKEDGLQGSLKAQKQHVYLMKK